MPVDTLPDIGLNSATKAELLAMLTERGTHISPRRYNKAVRDELTRMEAERPARLAALEGATQAYVDYRLEVMRLREWLERRFGGAGKDERPSP